MTVYVLEPVGLKTLAGTMDSARGAVKLHKAFRKTTIWTKTLAGPVVSRAGTLASHNHYLVDMHDAFQPMWPRDEKTRALFILRQAGREGRRELYHCKNNRISLGAAIPCQLVKII